MEAIITTIDQEYENLEKSRVKSFMRTRRGKLERVGEFERRGEAKKKFSIGQRVVTDFYAEDGTRFTEAGRIEDPRTVVGDWKFKKKVAAGKAYYVKRSMGTFGAELKDIKDFKSLKEYKQSKEFKRMTKPKLDVKAKKYDEANAFRTLQNYLVHEPGSPMLKKLKGGGYRDADGNYVSPKQLIRWAKEIEKENR